MKKRLDVLLVERGLAESRAQAQALVLAGLVPGYEKPGQQVDDADSQEVLNGVARALVPGGSFLIDTINAYGLSRRYEETMWNDLESGGVMLHRGSFDLLRGRNEVVWTFVREDGSRSELSHSLRVYAPHELARMLETAGLTVAGSWGGFDGKELGFDTRRLILRGDKP